MILTKQQWMECALGVDQKGLMLVLNMILEAADMYFTNEEVEVMFEMLADPERRLEVVTMLADGGEKKGIFG